MNSGVSIYLMYQTVYLYYFQFIVRLQNTLLLLLPLFKERSEVAQRTDSIFTVPLL